MAVMRAHRFEVGQTVGVVQGSAGPAMPTGRYVVVRLMPSAQGEHHYRVKSATDGRSRKDKCGPWRSGNRQA